MTTPSTDPIIQKLQVLLSGSGYDFYDNRNTMRANDLLIRQRASGALSHGARSVSALEVEFKRLYIPAATRNNPFPPADAMEALRALGRLRSVAEDLSTQILGMAVPAQDKIWWRLRDENTTLARLLNFDYELMVQTQELEAQLRTLTAEQWHELPSPQPYTLAIETLKSLIRERAQFLQIGQ